MVISFKLEHLKYIQLILSVWWSTIWSSALESFLCNISYAFAGRCAGLILLSFEFDIQGRKLEYLGLVSI